MFNTMGTSGCGVYYFFASMMVASIIFVYFLIPETKAVPLEYMDRLFAIKPVRNANKIVIDEVRRQEDEFRHDAEGAGLSAAKTNLEHSEFVHQDKV